MKRVLCPLLRPLLLSVLLALCVLTLAGCGKPADEPPTETPSEQPAAPVLLPEPEPAPAIEPAPAEEPDDTVFAFNGIKVPVPAEYVDLLVIDTELEAWNAHRTPLVSFSEKASVEAGQIDHPGENWGEGFLCTISLLDRVGFEDWLSNDEPGTSLFARNGENAYYCVTRPTDVRLEREGGDLTEGLPQWQALNEWAIVLPDEITAENGFEPYDASELFAADFTYPGEHVELGYRIPGDPMDLVVLSLSQPAKQGVGGLWCVERVRYIYSEYNFTDTQLVFPAALGVDEPAADYYARLQAECDAGNRPGLLTPRGAALDYARSAAAWLFGEDVSETDFETMDALG